MNILATQYTLTTKSLEIYISGCSGNPHCKNCHNPETWDFNQGDIYNKKYFNNIKDKVIKFDSLINNIMILGGEPLDNNHDELILFLNDLKLFNKKIWLFTRFSILEVPYEITELCDYMKCGKYKEDLTVDNNIQFEIKLATSNQVIYKITHNKQ
jgi:anaerobic ribonucleoside-triphosphate reductase activating protein